MRRTNLEQAVFGGPPVRPTEDTDFFTGNTAANFPGGISKFAIVNKSGANLTFTCTTGDANNAKAFNLWNDGGLVFVGENITVVNVTASGDWYLIGYK